MQYGMTCNDFPPPPHELDTNVTFCVPKACSVWYNMDIQQMHMGRTWVCFRILVLTIANWIKRLRGLQQDVAVDCSQRVCEGSCGRRL